MLNLTQQELARQLGISELSVIKYEGGTTIPSKEIMLMIYQFTGGSVTPNDFFDLESLQNQSSNAASPAQTFVAAGLMSGTSMDGIDAALIITEGENFIKEIGSCSLTYDQEFKMLMKGCERAIWKASGDLHSARQNYVADLKKHLQESQGLSETQAEQLFKDLCLYFNSDRSPVTLDHVVRRSTELHIEIIQKLLNETGYKPKKVDVIGYHGQTVFHRPASRITLQLGDGQLLATNCGITTVYDFRSNDVLHGGQGAPFAPLYHRALASQMGLTPSVIANCGGISNITVIGQGSDDLYAFDCGPGNTLIDRFVQLRVGKPMDADGLYGSQGTVVPDVLEALRNKAVRLADGRNFLQITPPKSLDVNDLFLIEELNALSLQDGCATLEAFTAECIVNSLDAVPFQVPDLWILAGGGWQNPVITNHLKRGLTERFGPKVKVQHADQVGWNGKAMEAQIFAYLAVRSLRELALSLPGTTGVPRSMTGGTIAYPTADIRNATKKVRDLSRTDHQ